MDTGQGVVELNPENWQGELMTVASYAEFEAALRAHQFDLLLSQATASERDGAWALALARREAPQVPFLFVSGHASERSADFEKPAEAVEANYRRIFEQAPEGIYQIGLNGFLIVANAALAEILGYATATELCAQPGGFGVDFYQPRGRRTELQGILAEHGSFAGMESQVTRPDGGIRWISESARAVRDTTDRVSCFQGTVIDITARKQQEAELQQSHKMEIIAQLAGGVAHDFNNAVIVINGYSRLLLDNVDLPEKAAVQLRQIHVAGMRVGVLTRQLLLFSRKHVINKRVIGLNAHLVDLLGIFQEGMGGHIQLERELAPDLPPVFGDPGMLEQVMLNLCENARDAMPVSGVLRVQSKLVTIDESNVGFHPGRLAGEFIRLRVSDTGCGIDPVVLPRIFEPFYTTKETSTGLGLATVFGIVREHGGWIEVESAPAQGATFSVFLPVSSRIVPGMAGPPETALGGETILLVEDEPMVRELAAAVLVPCGYRVLQANSGLNALEVWKRHSSRISLLLTDMVMPDGVSGLELADSLQAEAPALPVVLMSGYTVEIIEPALLQRARTRFIQKPFKPDALRQVVRESLDAISLASRMLTPAPSSRPL